MFNSRLILKWFLLFAVALTITVAGSAQQSSSTPGVTADTIKLGAFIAQSGPVAGIGVPFMRGAEAWYSFVNAHGGINGRKIDFIVCDDGFVPANTVACVKKLLEEDKVFAIVNPLGTSPLAAVLDTLVKEGVPVVSPGANATFLSQPVKPNVFALQPSNVAFGRFTALYPVQALGAKRVAAVYSNDAFGNELKDAFVAALKEQGLEPVALIGHAPNETNFSNIVLQLQQAKPDAVALLDLLQPSAAILKEAENLGFKTQFIGVNTVTDPRLFQLAGSSAAEGLIAPGFAADPTSDIPGAVLYRAVLNDPNTGFPKEPAGGFSEIAMVGAQLVTQGLASAGKDLTRQSFIDALNQTSAWSTGLTPPFSYTPKDHSGIKSLFVIQVKGGQFISLGAFVPK